MIYDSFDIYGRGGDGEGGGGGGGIRGVTELAKIVRERGKGEIMKSIRRSGFKKETLGNRKHE